MEDCSDCLSLKKQLEDLKQKHLLDFRTIKQKIISTDTLIRSYQEKCQEYDKQKKYVLELTSKLDGAQRTADVFKLQLKKTLEIKEPLKKKCDELERENAFQRGEIEALQDRLKGSENLVGQLQTVIKQGEDSAEAMRIDTSLHAAEIDEYKKSVKKNEVQISKLNEQVLKEKKANKEINKVLIKTQSKVKTLLDEAEESKKMIAELRKQLTTRENDYNDQPTRTSLEKQLVTMKDETEEYKKIVKELKEEIQKVKQQNTDENKTPEKNKVKSPTTPKWSLRTRKSVTPKRAEASETDKQSRPFTRLQQKNLVEEIEKASLQNQIKCTKINHASQQKILTSESESDEEPKGTLMDKVNLMLDVPVCPSLSPLPSSPILNRSSESGSSVSGFESNDPDRIFDDVNDNFGCGVFNDNLNRDVQEDISNNDYKDDYVSIGNTENGNNDNIGKDDIDDINHSRSKDDHENIDSNVSKDSMKTAEVDNVLDHRTVDNKVDKRSNADGITNDDGNTKTFDRDNDNSHCNSTSAEKKSHNDENESTEFESVETNFTVAISPTNQNDTILEATSKTEGESVLHNRNVGQVKGKKRELANPEYGGTIMTLRSRKKRKSCNSGIAVGIFSKDTEASELQPSKSTTVSGMALRNKSVNLANELDTPTAEACVRITRSKSLQERSLAEGILGVRPRRRTKRRISSNDDDDNDQSLVCSDTSALENNLNTSKHFLSDSEEERKRQSWKTKETTGRPRTRSMDEPCKKNMIAKAADINEKGMDGSKDTAIGIQTNIQTSMQLQITLNKLKKLKTMSTDESFKQDIAMTETAGNDDLKSIRTEAPKTKSQTNFETLIKDQDTVMETPKRSRTSSVGELSQQDTTIIDNVKCNDAEVLVTENRINFETAGQNKHTLMPTPRRPRIRSMDGLPEPEIGTKIENREDAKASGDEVPWTESQHNSETFARDQGTLMATPKRSYTVSVGELSQQGTTINDDAKCNEDEVLTTENGTSVETAVQDGHQWMATPRRPRTRSMDRLREPGIAARSKSKDDAKASRDEVPTTKNQNSIETLNQDQDTLVETSRRPRTRSVSESSQQKRVLKAEYNEDMRSSRAELPETKRTVCTVALNPESSRQCQDTFKGDLGMVTKGKDSQHLRYNETKISDSENNADNDGSFHKSNYQNQHISVSELLERNQIENRNDREAISSLVNSVFAQADGNIQSSRINVTVSDENLSTAENRGEKDFNEVSLCLKSKIEVVANETSDMFLSKKIPTQKVTRGIVVTEGSTNSEDPHIKVDVSDCLNAIIDSVVNCENYFESPAVPNELACEKPLRTKSCNSDVVEKSSESVSLLKDEINHLNDSQVKSGKCHSETDSMEIRNKDLDSKAISDLKQTDKTTVNSLDSSISPEPVVRTLTGNKLVRRKAHQRKTTVDSPNGSGNSTIDQNGKSETAKVKQNTETSKLICVTNEETNTVSDHVLNETKDHLTVNDNQDLPRTRKRKRKTIDNSGCVFASNGKRKVTGESDTNKSSFDVKGFLNPPDLESVASTPRTMFKTNRDLCNSKEDFVREKSTKPASTISSQKPTTPDETSPSLFSPRDSMDSWDKQLEQMSTSLSPLPNTPRRPERSTEILSFHSFDDVPPLSPIPPSPCRILQADEVEDTEIEDQVPRNQQEQEVFEAVSADSTGRKLMKSVEPSISNLIFDEKPQRSLQERQATKKPKINTDELPSDALNRYPNVRESKYTSFMFTKLEGKEITTKELVKAFSQRKNVRNHTPIIDGLIEVLRITQNDVEHALMERYAEQCECAMSSDEDTGEPIVSEFEMDVLVALYRLCNYQRLSSIMQKLVKNMEIHLCEVFRSGKNDAGFLAMCRIYTGVCRLMSEGGFIRMLCYDILKQNQRHSLTERMLLAIACVWPDVFGKGTQPLSILPGAVSISGPPYEPFLATLQVTFLSREMSSELTSQWFQRRCGWCNIPRDSNVLEWLARDLVRLLRVTRDVKPEENLYPSATMNNPAFETIKSLELISVIMGWKWTNDVLIREVIWPLLKEWKMRVFDKKGKTTVDIECSVLSPVSVENQVDISKMVDVRKIDNSDLVGTPGQQLCDPNMEAKLNRTISSVTMESTISNILRLLGRLGCEGLQKEEMINLDAVINLLCAVVTSSHCETVTQVAASYALLDVFVADPITISQVLENWRTRASKIDKKLTAEFALRLKEVKAQAWTKSVQ